MRPVAAAPCCASGDGGAGFAPGGAKQRATGQSRCGAATGSGAARGPHALLAPPARPQCSCAGRRGLWRQWQRRAERPGLQRAAVRGGCRHRGTSPGACTLRMSRPARAVLTACAVRPACAVLTPGCGHPCWHSGQRGAGRSCGRERGARFTLDKRADSGRREAARVAARFSSRRRASARGDRDPPGAQTRC